MAGNNVARLLAPQIERSLPPHLRPKLRSWAWLKDFLQRITPAFFAASIHWKCLSFLT